MSPLFTILLPIVRPPVMLPFAIESVLAQSITEFELFIICDGAPPETVACARDYASRDSRVKVHSFLKGQRLGEAYRHAVLGGASGRYVAQIADDDLWFPSHLEALEKLLSKADFGNLLHVFVVPNGRVEINPGDIGLPETRQRMLAEPFNPFAPTVAGYRLEAYRGLAEGWAPAPANVWSDLHMWRKFFRMENYEFATRAEVTALVFATPLRRDVTLEQRRDENCAYWQRIRDPVRRDEIVEQAWHSLLDRVAQSGQWANWRDWKLPDATSLRALAFFYEHVLSGPPSSLEKFLRIKAKANLSRFREADGLPADFDPLRYVALHPDLFADEVDPFEHFVVFGHKEGRAWS